MSVPLHFNVHHANGVTVAVEEDDYPLFARNRVLDRYTFLHLHGALGIGPIYVSPAYLK